MIKYENEKEQRMKRNISVIIASGDVLDTIKEKKIKSTNASSQVLKPSALF